MKTRDAIRVLMLSPLYFRLDLPARKALILEFIAIYNGTFDFTRKEGVV